MPNLQVQPEQWMEIKGFEGVYEISNQGVVRSAHVTPLNLKDARYTRGGKHLKPGNTSGYWNVALRKEGKVKTYLIHRLVADHFLDNPDNLPEVNHKNGDKTDNRASELEWCSRQYNVRHCFETLHIKASRRQAIRKSEKSTGVIKEFGENLKSVRTKKKLSIRKLADLADMDFSQVHKIEKGESNPTLTSIVVLSTALGVDPCELIPRK